jgi:hypothetical protein
MVDTLASLTVEPREGWPLRSLARSRVRARFSAFTGSTLAAVDGSGTPATMKAYPSVRQSEVQEPAIFTSAEFLNELAHLNARERFAVLLRALIEQHVPASVDPDDAAYFLAMASQDVLESSGRPGPP